jgi:hypothetical protein
MRVLPLVLASVALWGQEFSTGIEPGHVYQRSVPIGQTDVIHFQVASTEQIVSLKLVPLTEGELICRFYAPAGEFRRAFSTKIRGNPTFTFFAAEAGDWRLEVSSPGRRGVADFEESVIYRYRALFCHLGQDDPKGSLRRFPGKVTSDTQLPVGRYPSGAVFATSQNGTWTTTA